MEIENKRTILPESYQQNNNEPVLLPDSGRIKIMITWQGGVNSGINNIWFQGEILKNGTFTKKYYKKLRTYLFSFGFGGVKEYKCPEPASIGCNSYGKTVVIKWYYENYLIYESYHPKLISQYGNRTIPRYSIIEKPDTIDTYMIAGFSKESLQVGDTVDIVIKKKTSDGNLENFEDGNIFEVGVKEGCEYGEILKNNGETGLYFLGISEPIRYIVKKDLSASEGKVKIKLGINSNKIIPMNPEDPGDISINENNSIKNVSAETLTYSINEEEMKRQNQENLYCSVNDFLTNCRTNFSGVIENEDCDFDNNLCDGVAGSIAPKIKIKNVGTSYFNEKGKEIVNICTHKRGNHGEFWRLTQPQYDNDSFDKYDNKVAICFDKTKNRWLSYIEGEEIVKLVGYGGCPKSYDIYIESIDDLLNKINTQELAEQAMVRFFEQTKYWERKNEFDSLVDLKRIGIKEAVEHHEEQHRKDFENKFLIKALSDSKYKINENLTVKSYKEYVSNVLNYDASKNNCKKALELAKKDWKKANKILCDNIETEYKDSGPLEDTSSFAYNRENAINDDNAMRRIIKKYQEILLKKYPQIENKIITKNPVYGGKQRGKDFKVKEKEGNN